MQNLDLGARARAAVAEVAHDRGIGVEFDLVVQMLLGERDEDDAAGLHRRLHLPILARPATDHPMSERAGMLRAMTYRNRVTPLGEIVAVPLRCAWTGNRGCLHVGTDIVRSHGTDLWITCAL